MIEKLIEIHFSDVQPKKKAQILASSLCLFANNGYHGTSIMNIAKRANVSKSLIYSHFSSKDDLVIQIMKTVFEKFSKEYDFSTKFTYQELVSYWAEKSFELIDKYPELFKMYISLTIQKEIYKIVEPYFMELANPMLKDIQIALNIEDDKKAINELMYIGSVIDGLCFNYLYNKDLFPMEYSLKRLKEMFKNFPK